MKNSIPGLKKDKAKVTNLLNLYLVTFTYNIPDPNWITCCPILSVICLEVTHPSRVRCTLYSLFPSVCSHWDPSSLGTAHQANSCFFHTQFVTHVPCIFIVQQLCQSPFMQNLHKILCKVIAVFLSLLPVYLFIWSKMQFMKDCIQSAAKGKSTTRHSDIF